MEIQNIGRYEIKRELGRGGMATVYLGYDPSFDREVAIKILPLEFLHNPSFLERFQREVKTIAKLEHPAIVPVYDVGEYESMPYLVMRYMPGGSLSDQIEKGRISLPDTARMVERLAAALSYAHRKGIIHRDLKPDNILFNSDGYPCISDFGIAKFAETESSLTKSGIIGTPAYMSPEQATGDVIDQRSDVYGLGVIVYQMLTGQQPYNADTPMGVAIKHITDPIPDILSVAPDLPPEMRNVMKTVLAKDKETRYPTAVEFARALNQAAFGSPGTIKESTPTVQPEEKVAVVGSRNKKFYIAGAVGLIVLLLSLFAAGKLFNKPQNSPVTAASALVPITSSSQAASSAPACGQDYMSSYSNLIKETLRDCNNGAPYTNYLIPAGTTFKVLDDGFTCNISATRQDGDVITCTGKNLALFKIELCDLPDAPSLITDSGQCSEGSGLDQAHQCCTLVSDKGTACYVYTARTRSCN